MSTVIRTSHSTLKDVVTCPRLILFKKDLNLFPAIGDMSLRYGGAYHAAMAAYYESGKNVFRAIEAAANYWQAPTPQTFHEDYRNLDSLLQAIDAYHGQYESDKELIYGKPETKIVSRLHLSDEEKEIFGDIEIDFVLVIDLILKVDDMLWVVDFKTTSVDLPYIASRLRRTAQLIGYQFVAQLNIPSITGCMVYYHQLKATKSKSTGLYGAIKTDFMKWPMIFNKDEYNAWRKYIVFNAYQQHKGREAGFPPRFDQCYRFNKQCEYLPLCSSPKWDLDRFAEMDGFVVIPPQQDSNERSNDNDD